VSAVADRPGAPAGELPLRPELRGQVPYGAPQLDVAHRLNVNENPYPPPPAMVADVAAAVAEVAAGLNRYPDRDATALRGALAAYVARDVPSAAWVGAPHVWAANGSNEVMLQLLQAFGGPDRRALSFAPTYSMYPDYCRDAFTGYTTLPRREDFAIDLDAALAHVVDHQPDVVLLASPNNPTGTALRLHEVDALCRASRGVVVVDEAYAEFRRPGTPSAIELLADHPRLVVTRTMSKAFALAGARLGYLVASPAVVDAVQLVRLPYHLSAVTQAVARTALHHADALLAGVAALRAERDALVEWLRERPGLVAADSDANFVLFGRFADRDVVWQRLLDRGVLVRATGPTGWLRVSAGTPAEMAAFRAALVDSIEPGDVLA
jgi:histidinol-phosphate aminotransferase